MPDPRVPTSYDAVCDQNGYRSMAVAALYARNANEVTRGADLSMRGVGLRRRRPASHIALGGSVESGGRQDVTLIPVNLVAWRVTIARVPTSMNARKCAAFR